MGNISVGELPKMSRLDDARLAEVFRQGSDDPEVLDALNGELKLRHSDAAFDLHLKVVTARRALGRSQTSAEPRRMSSEPVLHWLNAFLGARKLTRSDERPLYRYRMTDSEYEEAKKTLRQVAGPAV
jgi:hypothetical protein